MPEIARYDNAWAGLISRVRFGKGLVDMVNGQKLSFVRPGAGLKRFERELVALGANVPIVEKNGQVLLLEGPATNKCTCAKSNPQALTNISKSGDAAAVLSVVNDAAALAAAGLSAFGPNVYKLDNSAGTAAAYALPGASVGNTNAHSVSVYARGSQGSIFIDGSSLFASISSPVYKRFFVNNDTPINNTRYVMISAAAGSIVYFILPDLEEGPVYTSPIPGGTGAITRASAGSDASGNGLQLPLTQPMIDSLKGNSIDLAASWVEVTAGLSGYVAYSNNNQTVKFSSGYGAVANIYKNSFTPMNLSIGTLYEINYTITGCSGNGSFRVRAGSSAQGVLRVTNGTFSERIACAGNAVVYFDAYNNFSGSVTINYVRRVLESGQTNPGEGTICQWVELPWQTAILPATGTTVPFIGSNNLAFLYFNTISEANRLFLYDGVNIARIEPCTLSSGRYCLISQWSAALGKMRVGLYNPTTDALTWGTYATYRGFFPIYGTGNQQRLRWGYGLGNLPIGLIEMRWFNRILSNSEVLYHAQEGLL